MGANVKTKEHNKTQDGQFCAMIKFHTNNHIGKIKFVVIHTKHDTINNRIERTLEPNTCTWIKCLTNAFHFSSNVITFVGNSPHQFNNVVWRFSMHRFVVVWNENPSPQDFYYWIFVSCSSWQFWIQNGRSKLRCYCCLRFWISWRNLSAICFSKHLVLSKSVAWPIVMFLIANDRRDTMFSISPNRLHTVVTWV